MTRAAMPHATATSAAVAMSFSRREGGNASANGKKNAVTAPAIMRNVLSLAIQQDPRVDRGAIQVHAEMQVRTRGAPGGADLADARIRGDGGTGLDVHAAQVSIERDQALPMVEHDGLAEEEVAAGVDGPTGGRGDDAGARRRGDVEAGVWSARRAVDDAPRAEAAGAAPAGRRDEMQRRRRGIGKRMQQVREVLALALELLELRGGKIGALGRDRQVLLGIAFRADADECRAAMIDVDGERGARL